LFTACQNESSINRGSQSCTQNRFDFIAYLSVRYLTKVIHFPLFMAFHLPAEECIEEFRVPQLVLDDASMRRSICMWHDGFSTACYIRHPSMRLRSLAANIAAFVFGSFTCRYFSIRCCQIARVAGCWDLRSSPWQAYTMSFFIIFATRENPYLGGFSARLWLMLVWAPVCTATIVPLLHSTIVACLAWFLCLHLIGQQCGKKLLDPMYC
jgi:hypothetical protein